MYFWQFQSLGSLFYSKVKKGPSLSSESSIISGCLPTCFAQHWKQQIYALFLWKVTMDWVGYIYGLVVLNHYSIHDLIYLAYFFYKKHYQIKRVHWLSFCRLYDIVWQQHPSPHNALVFLLHGWLFEGKLLCASVDCMYDTVSFFYHFSPVCLQQVPLSVQRRCTLCLVFSQPNLQVCIVTMLFQQQKMVWMSSPTARAMLSVVGFIS